MENYVYKKRLLILLLCLLLTVTGCSANDTGETEVSESTESIIQEEPALEYEHANAYREEVYSIEKYDIKLNLSYDTLTNMFLGTLLNLSGQTLTDVVIDIVYKSGLSVEKKLYVDVLPNEMKKISILGSYEDPKEWYADFSFGEDGRGGMAMQVPIITIQKAESSIPDDGIVIEGYRYANKDQLYILNKYGIDILFKYTPNNSGKGAFFDGTIHNITDKDISGINIGINMIGNSREDRLINYTVEANTRINVALTAFHSVFELWRPYIILTDIGIDETKDDTTKITVYPIPDNMRESY